MRKANDLTVSHVDGRGRAGGLLLFCPATGVTVFCCCCSS